MHTENSSSNGQYSTKGFPILLIATILASVILVLAPNLTGPLPDRDSGVFLYIGSQILDGKVPYLDIWDHKGPLIFLINAIAVGISPGMETGIWLLEGLFLIASGYLLYRVIAIWFGKIYGLAALLLFYGGLMLVLRPGNYTEEYGLLISITALLVFSAGFSNKFTAGSYILLGALLGAGLLLRPNNVAIQLSVILLLFFTYLAQREYRRSLIFLGWTALGCLTILMIPVLVLGIRGALPAFIDQYIHFNLQYSDISLRDRANSIAEGIILLAPSGLPILAIATWIFGIGLILIRSKQVSRSPILALGLIALPLEFLLVAVSGRTFPHYYINWIPILSVMAVVLLNLLIEKSRQDDLETEAQALSYRILLTAVVAACLIIPIRESLPHLITLIREGPRDARVKSYELTSLPEEHVLVWGAEVAFNYFSGKGAPTPLAYQLPLYHCTYPDRELYEAFFNDIQLRRPIIVDTSTTNPHVPPLNPDFRGGTEEQRQQCALSDEMVELMDNIWIRYNSIGFMQETGWPLYRYQE